MEQLKGPNRTSGPDAARRDLERPDDQRLASLAEAHGPELYRFLLGMLRDPEQARDALQSTYAKAIERGQEVDPASIRGWLFRVAAREAIDERRRGARRHRLERGFAWLREAAGPPDSELADPLIRMEEIEGVRAALETLPPDYLAVVRARIFEDKTFAQIAIEQRIPLGTAITRMRRALERLARRLRPDA